VKWDWQIVNKNGELWTNQKFLYDNAKFRVYHLNNDPKYKYGEPWKMQKINDDYWEVEKLQGGKKKVTVPIHNVDMLASTGQLFISIRPGIFNQYDIMKVKNIEFVVIGAKIINHPKHNFLLDIECDQMDELRELLTYAGQRIKVFYHKGNINNEIRHIRAIVDKEYIVYRVWQKNRYSY
jgi:hypothetical protein